MGLIGRTAKRAGLLLLGLLLLFTAAWGVLALYFFDQASPALRTGLAAAYGLASLAALAGIEAAFRGHADDAGLRVVILRGAGDRSFAAGGDITLGPVP